MRVMNRKNEPVEYTIRRSSRKTIGLEITAEGLLVRAPRRASRREIEKVIESHRDWIREKQKQYRTQQAAAAEAGMLGPEDIAVLTEKAREYIPKRVAIYAPIIGVEPGRITIRNQRTKWGSCSSKGNINFNCLLMLTPPEVIDSIVVHELCHMKEMNHSAKFYEEVYRAFPEYKTWHRWLRENGGALMRRVQRD